MNPTHVSANARAEVALYPGSAVLFAPIQMQFPGWQAGLGYDKLEQNVSPLQRSVFSQ